MKPNQPITYCQHCAVDTNGLMPHILQDGAQYSLCKGCGNHLKNIIPKSTKPVLDLYSSLIKKGVPAKLQKFAGRSTSDIHIVPANLKIAITANSLLHDPHKALTDFINTFQNLTKEVLTIKIPHVLIAEHLQQVSSYITAMIKLRQLQLATSIGN